MYLMMPSLSEMAIQVFATYVLRYIDAKIQTPDLMILQKSLARESIHQPKLVFLLSNPMKISSRQVFLIKFILL